MLIKVRIFCNTDNTNTLKELGVEIPDEEYSVREGKLNTAFIIGYYPNEANTTTIVNVPGSCLEIDLPYNIFDNLVCKSEQ